MAKRTSKKVEKKKKKKTPPTSISFDYIKSNQFRVSHIDGIHGGVTPNGLAIQMALFSERAPIPKTETYKLSKARLGKRINSIEREAVIREVELEAIMSPDTAKRVIVWLQEKIGVIEALQQEGKKK
ncbi:hypothetical protein ACFL3G_02885 [Planctomycetota bacterium]